MRYIPVILITLAALMLPTTAVAKKKPKAKPKPTFTTINGKKVKCTLVAKPKQRVIRGTKRRDVICAGKGRTPRTVTTGAGNDVVVTGNGADEIDTGNGADTVISNGGDDEITLGTGNDSADSGDGKDSIIGNSGDDVLKGSGNNDELEGNAGDDKLIGNEGADSLNGGDGSNTCDQGTGQAIYVGNTCLNDDAVKIIDLDLDSLEIQQSDREQYIFANLLVSEAITGTYFQTTELLFVSPSGNIEVEAKNPYPLSIASEGIYFSLLLTIPAGAEAGTWTFNKGLMLNSSNKIRRYTAEEPVPGDTSFRIVGNAVTDADLLEPNNSQDKATAIQDPTSKKPLASWDWDRSVIVHGNVSPDDEDWYTFTTDCEATFNKILNVHSDAPSSIRIEQWIYNNEALTSHAITAGGPNWDIKQGTIGNSMCDKGIPTTTPATAVLRIYSGYSDNYRLRIYGQRW